MGFLLKLFLISSCLLSFSCTQPHMSEAEKAVNHLIQGIEKKLTQKYHVRAVGITIGMPGGIVKKLGISFQLQGPISKEELRKLLISITQDFADDVNADQDIKPFLENYPFEIKNVRITFLLIDSSRLDIDHPDIGIAGINQGILYYATLKYSDMPPMKTWVEETYEEAMKILQEQTISQPKDLQPLQKN